jgi:23S rRNA (uridine2552-2'-O)-methyltransferase
MAGKEGGGIHGRIIGLDLLPMEPIADVDFIQGDFREQVVADQLVQLLEGQKLDLVLSDMAPNLSGIAAADAARIEDIVDLAIEFASQHLKPSGCLLVKCFNGSGYNQILEQFRQVFRVVSSKKPKASRDRSSEIFLLGRGLKPGS